MRELKLINAMIRLEGQRPLEYAEDHPNIPMCRDIITEVLDALSTKGLWFNTRTIQIRPDINGDYLLPDNVQQVIDKEYNVIMTDGGNDVLARLDGTPMPPVAYVRVSTRPVLDRLPETAYNWVKAECRRIYATDIIKDPTEADQTEKEARIALAELRAENIRQVQYNSFLHSRSTRSVMRTFGRNPANRGF